MKYCLGVILVLSGVFASSKELYRNAGINGNTEDGESNECPLQCRCIALSHLGYREMAERWSSLNRMHSSSRQVWRGTEAPIWREDPSKLRGRDVVCMGLNKVPKPLPAGKSPLSSFGPNIRIFVSEAQLPKRKNAVVYILQTRNIFLKKTDGVILR